jgi:hypothetical protein
VFREKEINTKMGRWRRQRDKNFRVKKGQIWIQRRTSITLMSVEEIHIGEAPFGVHVKVLVPHEKSGNSYFHPVDKKMRTPPKKKIKIE